MLKSFLRCFNLLECSDIELNILNDSQCSTNHTMENMDVSKKPDDTQYPMICSSLPSTNLNPTEIITYHEATNLDNSVGFGTLVIVFVLFILIVIGINLIRYVIFDDEFQTLNVTHSTGFTKLFVG